WFRDPEGAAVERVEPNDVRAVFDHRDACCGRNRAHVASEFGGEERMPNRRRCTLDLPPSVEFGVTQLAGTAESRLHPSPLPVAHDRGVISVPPLLRPTPNTSPSVPYRTRRVDG